MTRLTNTANFVMPPSHSSDALPREFMSDARRAALGQAEIDAGNYIEGEELEAFLDSLTISADEA
ncbi:MAG TPA: hypothetical protein VN113_05590 [Caulobacter sp.]|nr:hypothetical protein [Caulobacter sp.]